MSSPPAKSGDVVITDVDGVPLFWADAPGPLTAVLMFRVGRADEPLRTLGLSHLVEHLALWSSRHRTHSYNGWVEDAITGFHATGRPDEVCAFLRDVTSSLGALPVDRLEVERRVLAAESASRGGGGAYAHHRALRFGPCGYGLVDHYEYAIDWIGADALQSYALERFTAGNAVLWLSGPPPDDLALALPRGSRRAPTAPEAIAGIRLPARADAPEHGGVSVSMLGARTGALHAGFGILVDRAVEELRRTAGMSYAPQGSYELLDGRTANPYLYADCRAPDAPEVQRALVEILDDLAARGPTNAELERDSDRLSEWITDDDARRSHLNFHARNHLLGVPATSLEELRDERAALSADAVAATLADALKSLLVVGPARRAGAAGRELAAYELPEPPEQHGTRYVTTAQWRAFKLDVTVDLGEDGLTYRRSYANKEGPATPAVSVLFGDVVTAVRLASGGLTLISKTHTSLQLHGERLQGGAELLATVERKLGADRIVALSATERRVVDAVAAQIPTAHATGLGGEIDRLPGMLGDREDLVCLAAARRDDQEGLVAVTTDRMLFLFDGADGLDGVQVQRGEATGVAVKGAIRKRLVIEHHETTTTLHAFRPAQALAQMADLLRLPS